jgi:hypothetical protein
MIFIEYYYFLKMKYIIHMIYIIYIDFRKNCNVDKRMLSLCNDVLYEISKYFTTEELLKQNLYLLFTNKRSYEHNDWCEAAKLGKLKEIIFLDDILNINYEELIYISITNKHTNIIEWIYLNEKKYKKYIRVIIKYCVIFGSLSIIQFLHSIGEKRLKSIFDKVASEGHYNVVEFLQTWI